MRRAWWSDAAVPVGFGVFLLVFGWVFPTSNTTVRGTQVGFFTVMGAVTIALGTANLLVALVKRRRGRKQGRQHQQLREDDWGRDSVAPSGSARDAPLNSTGPAILVARRGRIRFGAMFDSDVWDRAAAELGLEVHERPRIFGTLKPRKGHLAGTVDGFKVTIRKEPYGEGTVTGIRIEFPSPIGPPGLEVKLRKHFRGRDGGRNRRGWFVFKGSYEKRAVLAKADDPNELAAWMTPTRIEALVSLPVRYRDVFVSREGVWTHRTGPSRRSASSKSIVEEVRRIIPLARHLI